MPTDENTRLRIRQYFVEQIDEQAADAIMESMPPVPWTELATKSDLRDLEARTNERFDLMGGQFQLLGERFDHVATQFDGLGEQITNQFVGFEGKLDSRYAETVRLSIFAVVSLMLGLITAVIAIVGLG